MGALAAAARTAGLASTSYEVPWSRPERWQRPQPPGRLQRQRCRGLAAPPAATQTSRHQQQQQPPQQRPWQLQVRHRRRLPVCHSFNLPDGLGENLRRLRGAPNQGQQGQQGGGQAGQAGAADDPQQPSVWSDWQGGAQGGGQEQQTNSRCLLCMSPLPRRLFPALHPAAAAAPATAVPCPLLPPAAARLARPAPPPHGPSPAPPPGCSRRHQRGLGGLGRAECGRPG